MGRGRKASLGADSPAPELPKEQSLEEIEMPDMTLKEVTIVGVSGRLQGKEQNVTPQLAVTLIKKGCVILKK